MLSISGVYEHIRNPAPDPTSELNSRSSPTKFVHSNEDVGDFNLGNATALVGQTAHLHCAVENLGDRTVSQSCRLLADDFFSCNLNDC